MADGSSAWSEPGRRQLPIPQSVREAIGRRLDRLSPECNEILATAAAIGREFGLPVLTRVSEREPEQLLEALEEATTARLIEDVPRRVGGYRFGARPDPGHALRRS